MMTTYHVAEGDQPDECGGREQAQRLDQLLAQLAHLALAEHGVDNVEEDRRWRRGAAPQRVLDGGEAWDELGRQLRLAAEESTSVSHTALHTILHLIREYEALRQRQGAEEPDLISA